ncbi:hypothetical protein PoB_000561100 [Plakobranchus ocellatus]|uniref:Uncharacterized protein n=1 Tax=Plakobranchus ocellatus TaxID=259542 RepID=A0AAV3Y9L7_9GAST|nr:hypothetical protein PoB_000561100 [Plakobranchus ocellatus]
MAIAQQLEFANQVIQSLVYNFNLLAKSTHPQHDDLRLSRQGNGGGLELATERATATAPPALHQHSTNPPQALHQPSTRIKPVHNKMIPGFQTLRQARALVAGLKPSTEGSLQISGRMRPSTNAKTTYAIGLE